MPRSNGIKVFAGNAHPVLAKEICRRLHIKLGRILVDRFPDGEVKVQIQENVRGSDVFVVQPTCRPVNENLVELLVILDALRRASAKRITAVIPYYGYARQDRKDRPRVPITSKLVADLLTSAGASRVVTLDLHVGQIQGFFNIPVDHLYATPVLGAYFKKLKLKDLVVVSPDSGGVERARAFAKRLNVPLAIIDKRREDDQAVEIMNVIGNVEGKTALIVDDMIDTGGTLVRSIEALLTKRAKKVYACATHPVFAGEAIEKLIGSRVTKVVVSNSIPLSERAKRYKRIHVLSVGDLLAETIRSVHQESSVSRLFI